MCALFLTLDPIKPGPMFRGMREIVRKQIGPSGKENHICQGTERVTSLLARSECE